MLGEAFVHNEAQKTATTEIHFAKIMHTLGLDLSEDSLKGTPHRVPKLCGQEIFSGLNLANKSSITLFDNKYLDNQMLVEKNITFFSNCEHPFVPIIGKANVAEIS